jgi:hypothetical protein
MPISFVFTDCIASDTFLEEKKIFEPVTVETNSGELHL